MQLKSNFFSASFCDSEVSFLSFYQCYFDMGFINCYIFLNQIAWGDSHGPFCDLGVVFTAGL